MKFRDQDVLSITRFVKSIMDRASPRPSQKRVEVCWNFAESCPELWPSLSEMLDQPEDIETETGLAALEPVHYWLFGLAASFADTFVRVAELHNVALFSLKVVADHSDSLVDGKPGQLGLRLVVDAEAKGPALDELLKLASARCPGVTFLSKEMKLLAQIEQTN